MKFKIILFLFLAVAFDFDSEYAAASSAIPIANFVANNTSICESQCISFTDLSNNSPTSWTWSFQGASISSSTQQNPSGICYNTSGTYFVSLTVSNASGSNTLFIAGYINVYPSSVVNLLVNGDFNNYNIGFTNSLIYVPTGTLNPTQYTIDTNAVVHNGNWAGISPDSTPFFMCDGDLVAGTVVWSENLSNVFPSSAYTFSYLMTNLDVNHTFVMPELLTTVTDQLGNVLFTGTTGLLPAANTNVPPVYVWTPFNYVFTTLANTTSITIALSQVGAAYLGFDFALEDMNLKTHFCDSLTALPDAGMFTDENVICPGTCSDFISLATNATSVQWLFPGGNPSVSIDLNPLHICYNSPGSYDVTIIATNASGTDTLTIPGYISVLPYPSPQGITQSGDTLFAIQGAVNYQWYHNGTLINGATDYFYTATGSGNFNVVATDVNGCQVEAAIFDVVAEIPFTAGNSQLAIFPNPVYDQLTIRNLENINGSNTDISIFNVIGDKVFMAVDSRQPTVNCSFLPPGIYWLEINTDGKLMRVKFIKSIYQ
ncbi:MAG: PKD domain-containing protein [Bacteroidota bacterium]